MSIRRSTRKAFAISLSLHALFLCFFIASALSPPPVQPIPHRLLVQSIALLPPPRHRSSPVMTVSAQPLPQPEVRQEPPSPPLQEPESNEGPAAAREEPQPPPDKVPPAVEKPQPVTKPAASVKPSTTAKPQPAKKTAQTPTTAPKTKAAARPAKKPAADSKVSPSRSSAKKPSSPSYDQKLLSEALERLDTSKKMVGKGSGNGGGSSARVARVGAVGSLNVEQGLAEASDHQDSAYEGYASASPEACYIGDLIRRLQLNVRLPEPGEVKVKLTLARAGTVTRVQVLNGKPSMRKPIEEKLRSIHFSHFGTSFPGETDHTFSLRLSNDLLWSCS